MTLRTVYSTNNGMDPSEGFGAFKNENESAVAIGAGRDGRYSVNVLGFGSGYAIVSREELILIRDALNAELNRVN